MNVVPAVDLRDGCCVQLLGGAFDDELVRLADPLDVARSWRARGATALHVVDLDAAADRGTNAPLTESICAIEGIEVDVAGGVRDDATVARVLGWGARSAVVGTRAVEDPAWLRTVADLHPGRISLAVDVRDGHAATHGWSATSGRDAIGILTDAAGLELFQVVVTAVEVEGRTAGPDLRLAEAARSATDHRLAYAGGVASRNDLAALRDVGVDAVVIGTALYTGGLAYEDLIEEVQS